MMVVRFAAVYCCLICGLLAQNQPERNWNDKIQQLSFARRPVANYQMGSGDLIEIKVFGEERLSQQARISPSGEIAIPFLGSVQASGLTQFELEEKISSLLRGRLLQNPQVTVFVREYRSQPVFVLGAVKNPGNYQITQRLNLVDALAMAGGLDLARAGEEMIVQRPAVDSDSNPAATPELIRINLKQLLEEGNLALNLPLHGGDIIQVPERARRFFYVIGEVHRPGIFELPVEQDTYVTQALAQAGGPMRTAKTDKGVLVRFDNQGGRQEVTLNIEDILKGRRADLTVNPNDVIFVPGSTFKNIGYGLLGVIPTTISSSIVYGTAYR